MEFTQLASISLEQMRGTEILERSGYYYWRRRALGIHASSATVPSQDGIAILEKVAPFRQSRRNVRAVRTQER